MDLQVNEVLQTHGLNAKIIAYVKDESNNPSIMTIALTYNIVSYKVLGLVKPFIRSCWGHTMSKCFEYAINNTKVSTSLTLISIRTCHSILLKTIILTKKHGKGLQEWKKACLETNILGIALV
jgi:hypothetical protein